MQPSEASGPVDLERERDALLAVHAQDRLAHMTTNPELILAHAGDEFIYVGEGTVTRKSREQVGSDFVRIFSGATYQEWDDLEPPIVSVSDDGSMGWMIVRTRVRRTVRDGDDEQQQQFVYAGIMTYTKHNGVWVRVANVSTFEPDEAEA